MSRERRRISEARNLLKKVVVSKQFDEVSSNELDDIAYMAKEAAPVKFSADVAVNKAVNESIENAISAIGGVASFSVGKHFEMDSSTAGMVGIAVTSVLKTIIRSLVNVIKTKRAERLHREIAGE